MVFLSAIVISINTLLAKTQPNWPSPGLRENGLLTRHAVIHGQDAKGSPPVRLPNRRRLPLAVENLLFGPVDAQRQDEGAIRRGQPVGFYLRAGRFVLELDGQRTIRTIA